MTGQSPDPLLGLPLMTYGSFSESWGTNLNNAMITLIAQATVGLATISSSGGTYTLSATDYVTNEARKRVLKLTGTQASNLTLVIPPRQAWYWVVNSGTSGGNTAQIGVSGGLQVSLPYGRTTPVYTDGIDTWSMLPRLDQMPVPTAYLDMNGQTISAVASPTLSGHAATKGYVDAQVAPTLNTVGAPTGPVNFASQRIINLGSPINPNDGVNLQTLNGAIAAASISGVSTLSAAANTVLAGAVSGSVATTPSFRSLVTNDLPAVSLSGSYITTSQTVTLGLTYGANTSGAPITVTLPALTQNSYVGFYDAAGTFNVNNLTITTADGSPIMGLGQEMLVNTQWAYMRLWGTTSSLGWRLGP